MTDDKHFADVCRQIVNQGRMPNEPHRMAGTNARITEMQAAMGVAQMERIDGILYERKDVATQYLNWLDVNALAKRGIEVPIQRESWFAFPLTGETSILKELQAHLTEDDIQSSIYFPKHDYFPDFIWDHRLCLPFYTQMTVADIDIVVSCVNAWAS